GCAPNFAPTRTTCAGLGARPRARVWGVGAVRRDAGGGAGEGQILRARSAHWLCAVRRYPDARSAAGRGEGAPGPARGGAAAGGRARGGGAAVRRATCASAAHMTRRRGCRGGAETRSALLRDPDSQLQSGHGAAGGLGPGLGARRLLGGGLHRRRAAWLLGEFKTLPEPIVARITGQRIVQQAIERITLLDSLGHDVRCASNIIPGFLATLIRNRGQVQVFLVNRFVEVTHRVTSPP